MSEFNYELAISFLQQDQKIAEEIFDKLSEKYKIFVYSHYQEKLAGQDGEIFFTKVFEKEARLVVVLYRQDWAKKGWTKIEETGIRNRGYKQGYDFTLFVMLDDLKTLPEYIPVNRIWHNYSEYGIDGLISVINYKIGELGGEAKPISIIDKIKNKDIELFRKQKNKEYLNSIEAIHDGNNLFNEMKFQSEELMKQLLKERRTVFIKFEIERNSIIFKGEEHDSLICLEQGPNCHPILEVELYKMIKGNRYNRQLESEKIRSHVFKYHIDLYENKGWADENGKMLTCEQIINLAVEMLLDSH